MKLKTQTYVLPACWASALVNNDRSGLVWEDIQELDEFLNSPDAPKGSCLMCSDEAYFSRYNDAHVLAGNVLEYTFSVPRS